MNLTRQMRKTLTFGFLRIGMELARKGDFHTVETMRQMLRGLTHIFIPLRTRLAENMKSVGVYRPELLDAHFDMVIDQLIMMAHVFRAGFEQSGCPERFRFDDSFCILEQAYRGGKGVINISPHICGYPLYPPVVTPRIPCINQNMAFR